MVHKSSAWLLDPPNAIIIWTLRADCRQALSGIQLGGVPHTPFCPRTNVSIVFVDTVKVNVRHRLHPCEEGMDSLINAVKDAKSSMGEDDFSDLKIYVVDNGGQWTHREYRVIRDLGANVKIVPNDVPLSDISDADGIVLSGGSPSVGLEPEKLGRSSAYLDGIAKPVLGICVGHHFIAHHFGGRTGRGAGAEFGKAELEVIANEGILDGLPRRFRVWESHNDEVREAPPGFKVLASTKDCPVEAMMSLTRPIFSLQFHPEVDETEFGVDIFRNFLRKVAEWKSRAM